MIVYSILALLCIGSVTSKAVKAKDSCEESKTHFFVTDNASLQSADPIVYKATSEEECLSACTKNRDKFDRPIVCHSFTYDHASFSCTIHKEKSAPVGSAQIENSVGKRYFEKICLSHNIPQQCAQTQFIRVDQSVLVGYAVNMTLTDSIESCAAQCVQEADCKSAMYFYEDGECITNKESAMTKPAGFTKEENDKVIYFQNGCDLNKKNEPTVETEEVQEEVRPVAHVLISETTPKPDSPVEKVVEEVGEEVKPEMKPEEQFDEKQEETNAQTGEDEEEYGK
nr:protein C52B11.1 [imported] - Caenorhabditis elegans [Caenorhabditis elegans]